MTLVDLYEDDDGFFEAHDRDGQYRVPLTLWNRYRAAVNKLADLADEIDAKAIKPVYVTPDQEAAMRSVLKDDAWIIVREADALVQIRPVAAVPEKVVPLVAAAIVENEAGAIEHVAPEPPPGPPQRPPPGPCPSRSNLPHTAMRYVITEAMSVYDVGRVRVDGICQCGLRLADVRCPHQKQELNAANQPACKWCRQQLVSNAGAIDNRNLAWSGRSPDGAADPRVALPVPANASADDVPRDAYRAPGA